MLGVNSCYRGPEGCKVLRDVSRQINESRSDLFDLDDYELEVHGSYPDFCDSYIVRATHKDGHQLTDVELDKLNDDSEFVYSLVEKRF